MINPEFRKEVNALLQRAASGSPLSGLEKQRAFIARMHSIRPPCPWCHEAVSWYDAAPESVNSFSSSPSQDDVYTCPHCQGGLVHVMPLVNQGTPWFWEVDTKRLPPGILNRQ